MERVWVCEPRSDHGPGHSLPLAPCEFVLKAAIRGPCRRQDYRRKEFLWLRPAGCVRLDQFSVLGQSCLWVDCGVDWGREEASKRRPRPH